MFIVFEPDGVGPYDQKRLNRSHGDLSLYVDMRFSVTPLSGLELTMNVFSLLKTRPNLTVGSYLIDLSN